MIIRHKSLSQSIFVKVVLSIEKSDSVKEGRVERRAVLTFQFIFWSARLQ